MLDMAKPMDQKRRGAYYWRGTTPYISVTNILKVIAKPQLTYWFGKQVYLAMLINPEMTEQEALASPYKVSGKARDKGTTVHSIVESFKTIKTPIDVADEFKGYAKAFYQWIDDFKPEIIEHEKKLFSEKYKIAGTLDLLVKNTTGELMVIDVKTGKDIYLDAHIQTSAYKEMCVENGVPVKSSGILLLGEDGTYKFAIGENRFDTFLACKKLYETINDKTLLKINYYQI
jgi:hypothetical protein